MKIFLFFLTFCSSIFANELQLISFEYPPFMTKDDSGILQKKVKSYLDNKGIKYKSSILPAPRAMKKFLEEDVFFIGTKNQFNQSHSGNIKEINMLEIDTHLYHNSRINIKDIKSVAIIRGNKGELRLAKENNLKKESEVIDVTQALKLLERGRISAFFCIDISCDEIIRNRNYKYIAKSKKVYMKIKAGLLLRTNSNFSKLIN